MKHPLQIITVIKQLIVVFCLAILLPITSKGGEPQFISFSTPVGGKWYMEASYKRIIDSPALTNSHTRDRDSGHVFFRTTELKFEGSAEDNEMVRYSFIHFDSSKVFKEADVFVSFGNWASAKLWLEKFNDSKAFATNYSWGDIDFADEHKRYYVKDLNNENYLTVRPSSQTDGELYLIFTYNIPAGLQKWIDDAEKANKKTKSKSKGKSKK